jgi:predicted acetyltransferase
MTLDIRPVEESEIEQAEFVRAYSFNDTDRFDLSRAVERSRLFYPSDWSLGAFENGELTAFLRMIPFAMRINGRALSFGGVGPVVSLPQHRRKGHVGALLRRSLEVMRERGQVIAGLHTPHPTLYQRYGWEIASVRRAYRFAPKEIALKSEPSQRGRTRMLSRDEWAAADRVYRRYGAMRNGIMHRGEVWWREAIFTTNQPTPADVALWEDAAGEPQGYVVYNQSLHPQPGWPPFLVRELYALTPDAYLNLIAFILRHDLPKEITWFVPQDDPFLSLVDDATRLKVGEEYDMMLRICDVEGALRQRAPAYPEHRVALTIGVTDTSASWNEGRWRVEVNADGVEVERTDADADLSLSATTLAPLFNGFLSPSAAALAGRVTARDENVLTDADAFFATLYRPYNADPF